MKINRFTLVVTIILQTFVSDTISKGNSTSDCLDQSSSKVLSRRKRFLIFPDGSSLQLVFCVQTSAVIPIGDIFLFGNTAALAWSLPSDPQFFHMLKGDKEAMRRGDFKNHIYYVDENGKMVAKVPYKRSRIINPAFAKRSIDEGSTFKDKLKARIERLKMHERQKRRDYLKKEHMDSNTVEFHRSSRVELFEKIERLFTALGQDGRQCVLHKLCEAARSAPQQGTFLQEFLRTVFTLPKGSIFDNDDHKEYDSAHTLTDDCAIKYPGCENFQPPTDS
ncbi:uncharacterized protein LOC114358314 [Ostrinia furnacalis]|uniref:uncharacterized protein LOC114358314 n=1 Tax=Ostrinia furnacalis TaxID=93504 RepID=UPI00103B48CC|nr:uncharacterized protein LOC114358314 [Ostrinia furnacalis]